ncbi:MAG: helix-turn-helix domain-containing protein [Deltaproteobacteria bacterium]|nr:helix-turn-helix domain-containing protein [Deltaproteobacteria bacterium]
MMDGERKGDRGRTFVEKGGAAKPHYGSAQGLVHLWTTKEVAVALQVKEATIRHWVCVGYIPYVKFAGAVRFRPDVLQLWIEGISRHGNGKSPGEVSRELASEMLSAEAPTEVARRRGRRPGVRPTIEIAAAGTRKEVA